jgi:hypothetical protein
MVDLEPRSFRSVGTLQELPFIRGEVRLKRTSEGGRKTQIRSGYRCNCWIGGHTGEGQRVYNDAMIDLESQTELEPGGSAAAKLYPTQPASWSGLAVGDVIELCEGPRTVGEATLLTSLS